MNLNDLCVKYGFFSGLNRGTNKNNTGGDKLLCGFTDMYEIFFNDLKKNKINLLEIGIYQGRSLAMWSDYFKNGFIYGIDINLIEYNLYKKTLIENNAFSNKNVNVFEINSTNMDLNIDLPDFDIIIDDGDHDLVSQNNTFTIWWEKLKNNGIYIIEDCAQDAEIRLNNVLKLKNILLNKYTNIDTIEYFEANKRLNKGDKYLLKIVKK